MASRARQLRELLANGCVAMPGAFNALTARLIERVGFGAAYVSGAGITNATCGVPDIGLIGLEEFARLAGFIAQAVEIPVLSDADTGFGGPSNAARTVQMFEAAGLAGLHLEDQEFPKRCGHLSGKRVVPCDEMVEKIRAAVGARRDEDFIIIARTDARAVEGFDSAVERARRCLAAGADGVFPEALETPEEFQRFAQSILSSNPSAFLLANMTEFGKGKLLAVSELASMGYRMVIFPQTALRVGMKAAEQCLGDLKKSGTQQAWLDRMQTRKDLYELLDYDPNADVWPARFE